MALGGVTGIIAVTLYPNPFFGFAMALLVGLGFGALFALATVVFRANQVLCGLALDHARLRPRRHHRQGLFRHARQGDVREDHRPRI